MRHLQDFALAAALAAIYFVSVYFAIAALYLPWALPAGLIAAMLALLIYLVLVLTERDTAFVVALLFALSTSCIAAGMIWWVLRLLGLWVIK